jgi:uncharacterized membrane protein
MELVKFINGLINFGAIGDFINPILSSLPFHFMLHPAVVHFALVLPAIALLLQLMALVTKNESYRKASNYLFFLGVLAVIVATISGRLAGPDVKPLLNAEGQALFNEHMEIGYALALFYVILFFLKIISIFIKKRAFRVIMALLLIAGVGGLFVQAQHGGELVYKYAAGVDTDNIPSDGFDDDEDEEEE